MNAYGGLSQKRILYRNFYTLIFAKRFPETTAFRNRIVGILGRSIGACRYGYSFESMSLLNIYIPFSVDAIYRIDILIQSTR